MALGYHDEALQPGLPVVAIPTTAATAAETNTYGVITDASVGRKGYVGHPSVLPRLALLDPELTPGLAARTDRRDRGRCHDPLPRVAAVPEPQPVRGGRRAGHDPDGRPVATAGRRRRLGPRGARAGAARRPTYAGVGQTGGTGVGAAAAIGHALGTRGTTSHMERRSRRSCPEVFRSLWHPRPGARAGRRGAGRRRAERRAPAGAARAAIDGIRELLERVGQRRSLRALGIGADLEPVIVVDAIEDAAILNSPRLPTSDEVAGISPPFAADGPQRAQAGQSASTSGFTSPMSRSMVSAS